MKSMLYAMVFSIGWGAASAEAGLSRADRLATLHELREFARAFEDSLGSETEFAELAPDMAARWQMARRWIRRLEAVAAAPEAWAQTDGEDDEFDGFFGGWATQAKPGPGGRRLLDRPQRTNPDYARYEKILQAQGYPACGNDSLLCNPLLFGPGLCVPLRTREQRQSAYRNCERAFQKKGYTDDTVLQFLASANGDKLDEDFLKAVASSREICRSGRAPKRTQSTCGKIERRYAALAEKLGVSLPNGKATSTASTEASTQASASVESPRPATPSPAAKPPVTWNSVDECALDGRAASDTRPAPKGLYAAWASTSGQVRLADGSVGELQAVECSQSPSARRGKVKVYANATAEEAESLAAGNCLIDLASGKAYRAPGEAGGTLSPDGSLYLVPSAQHGLRVYRSKNVLRYGERASKAFEDAQLKGSAISIGAIGGETSGLRVLGDANGLVLRDYRDDGAGNLSPGAVVRLTDKKEELRSATLSPDGRYFAANNRRTRTTQIYEITPNGKRLVSDLGIETGRVAFAPARPSGELRIAFHIDNAADTNDAGGVAANATKDVVVMDLKRDGAGEAALFHPTRAARATAHRERGAGAYFPQFGSDGKLRYTQLGVGGADQAFVAVDPDALAFTNYALPTPPRESLCAGPKAYEASVVLGYLWAELCLRGKDGRSWANQISAEDAALYALALTRERCEKLASLWGVGTAGKVFDADGLFLTAASDQRRSSRRRPNSVSSAKPRPLTVEAVEGLERSDLEAVCQAMHSAN